MVRVAHASQPEPGSGAHVLPCIDGAGRSRRARCGACADPRLPACHDLGAGSYAAERIRGSRVVVLPGFRGIYTWIDDQTHRATMEAMAGFISRLDAPAHSDRVLATVLFTDIVGSTDHASRLGDRGWRDVLARHHAVVRRELVRHQGRELDTAGDGFFAAFDGPARADHGGHRHHRRAARAGPGGSGRASIRVSASSSTPSSRASRYRWAPGLVPGWTGRGPGLEHRQGPCGGLGDRLRGLRRPPAEGDPDTWHLFAVVR